MINLEACDDCSFYLASSSPPRGPQVKQRQSNKKLISLLLPATAVRCRRLRATNTDPRRPRGGLRTANRRIPLAWLPLDAPAPQGREAAKTFMGRGDGVLVGGRTLEDEARRYWTTTPAGFPLARPRPRLSRTASPKITVFTPKFSPYRSLRTTNEPNGPQTL